MGQLSCADDIDWEKTLVERLSEYAIFRLTKTGEVATWNAGAARIKGYSAEEIVGQPFRIFYSQEDRDAGIPVLALKAAGETGQFETEGWRLRKDGTRFWAHVLIKPLFGPDGGLSGFAKIVRDMTDKRLAHEAVIESERRFRLLVQGVTDYSIFMLSPEGEVTNWNLGAARIKGYSADEVIGTHFRRFYTEEDAARGAPERGLGIAAHDGRFETEGWRVRKDGSRFWANVVIDAIRDEDGALIGFAKITRDVTERKAAQEQLESARAALLQSQKMEAIGKLTGGVAHDFNNVLQVLRGNLELLERRHSADAWTHERLGKAIDAVAQGANLASQLLAFGRRQALQPTAVNLATMLRKMDDLLRRALGELIDVETVVAGGLWNTLVDPNHLENVVLNLAINGRDAMPSGGKLTLELSNAMLDEHYRLLPADVPEGQYVLLAITDTGVGMSPEVQERALEPFYTTKPEGVGTGLGLSMSYGFVKQSGGHMKIYSEEGYGTTVKLYLPRSFDAVIEDKSPARPAEVSGGSETILVVEDDRRVQSTVVEMLTELGYHVLRADDAQSAMAILRSGIKIDLLFSDVVMPGPMRSTELANLAVRMLPDLSVLFTSGYTQNAIVHGGRLDRGVQLLSKPYSREQLATKVRRLLAEGRRGQDAPVQAVSILLVDDDADSSDALGELLVSIGYQVRQASSAETALRALAEIPADVLVSDVVLAADSGIELAKAALDLLPGLKIVFVSGADMDCAALGFRCLALRKPFSVSALDETIRTLMAE